MWRRFGLPLNKPLNLTHTHLFGEIASWSYGLIANAYRQNKATIYAHILQ